jgi:hypothetical protein
LIRTSYGVYQVGDLEGSVLLVCDEHDAEHEEEDGEERAEWDEYTFAKISPAVAGLTTVFGAGGGLEGRSVLDSWGVLHLLFLFLSLLQDLRG